MIYQKLNIDEKELINLFYELDLNFLENPVYLLKNEVIGSGNSKVKVKVINALMLIFIDFNI